MIFIYFSFITVNRTCVDPDQSCNCDASLAKWLSDEGHFKTPASLGITEMYFIQQKDLAEKSVARITLGPLECVETSKSVTYLTIIRISVNEEKKTLKLP